MNKPNLELMENPEKGKLLVAEPFLGDPNFERSVILLTEHNEEGTVGYVLNRPMDLKLEDVIPDFPEFDASIFHGGPVEQSNLYFIHTRPDIFDGAIPISERLYWGGDFSQLQTAVDEKLITSSEIRFFLGYSGWSPGQLSAELSEKSWRVVPSEEVNVFEPNSTEMWKNAISNLGGDYKLWANAPSDPLLN